MVLTKKDIQKRVLKDGKPLDLKFFDWDKVNRTFKSGVDGLTIDFTNIDNVYFNTGNNCTFVTGSRCMFDTGRGCVFETGAYCMFKTGDDCIFITNDGCTFVTGHRCMFTTNRYCTFDTGRGCVFKTRNNCVFKTWSVCTFNTENDCTFNTGSDCTFITYHSCDFVTGHNSKIISKQNSEVIIPPVDTKLTICPLNTPGYLIGSDYYVNGVKKVGKYMIVDNILSKIISKKGKVFKVYKVYAYTEHLNSFSTTPTHILQVGNIFSHGVSIEEANESLMYKISNRDTLVYDNLKFYSVLSKEEAIKMYSVITGACEFVVRDFVASLTNIKDNYTIQEIAELTNSLYGNDELKKFFKIW